MTLNIFRTRDRDRRLPSSVRLSRTARAPIEILPFMRSMMRLLSGLFSQKERQRRNALAQFEQSSLFHHDWYLEHYPDVASSGIDPARHYLLYGWHEGRDPGPGFSTTAYLRANADVAALGINPLLHYVEYGHSEGRGAPDQAAPAPMRPPPLAIFGPAAECASFPLEAPPSASWKRNGEADASAESDLVLGRHFIGSYRDDRSRRDVQAALGLLARLSGASDTSESPTPIAPSADMRLLDAWHLGLGLLRTRWKNVSGAGATVVRVVQHRGVAPVLVGEAVIGHRLDVVDASLANTFFPLLFVFADTEGTLIGCRLLAFPSLCRGGAHFPELIALDQARPTMTGDPIDIIDVSDDLAAQLIALGIGAARPLLEAIHVDLEGADGTHPLFQPDFQSWLSNVARISVTPLGGSREGHAEEFLADAVRVTGGALRSSGVGTLVLASDMIPSISALVVHASDGTREHRAMMVPFVVAGEELSLPSILITVPPNWSVAGLRDFIPAYPHFESANGGVPVSSMRLAALRMPRSRPLDDADLLVPLASPKLVLPSLRRPSRWLIWPGAWRDEELFETLESLALQTSTGAMSLMFIGEPSLAVDTIARRLFERVDIVASLEHAVSALDTPLVGYVGQGIVLHDSRTVAVMSAALDDESLETASVVVVSVGKRWKGWVVAPADAGELETGNEPSLAASRQAANALLLWRSAWPVHRPPRDLWMTRTEALARWISHPGAISGDHLCTAVVSASYGGARRSAEGPLSPPRSDRALGIEYIVG